MDWENLMEWQVYQSASDLACQRPFPESRLLTSFKKCSLEEHFGFTEQEHVNISKSVLSIRSRAGTYPAPGNASLCRKKGFQKNILPELHRAVVPEIHLETQNDSLIALVFRP